MANKAAQIMETPANIRNAVLEEALRVTGEKLNNTEHQLEERLSSMSLMLEQRGWTSISEYGDEGPDLDQVKKASSQIRNLMALNPIIKRGSKLRVSYTWSKGVEFGGVKGGGRGRATNVQALIDNPINQRYVFSPEAHQELEQVAYSDGLALLLGDESAKTFQRLWIGELTADYRNPDNTEEVWAYRRTWQSYNKQDGVPSNIWYFTDTFADKRVATIEYEGKRETVDQGHLLIDQSFNGQVGWAYGVPDALSAITWVRLYKEFLVNGKIMSDALAQFAFKAVTQSKAGGDNASMKLAQPGASGSTAVLGGGNDLVPISSAGKGYDFDSGRPLAAQIAAGLEVSLVHLLSDPGASGSSYGSASNLDLPTKRAILSRQETWKSYYERILKFMGVTDPKVTFPTLDEPDFYREVQALLLGWGSGVIDIEEFRVKLLALLNIVSTNAKAPVGVMLPNNEKSLNRKDIDNDGSSAGQAQGNDTGVGAGLNANDLRSDTLSNSLKAMTDERIMEMLEEIKSKLDK
jgi:hypothetical protein